MTTNFRPHLVFLHTSPVHVPTFEALAAATDPAWRVDHVIHEDLLADAQRVGADDPALVDRVHHAMTAAAASGAAMVVCTCSTIGGAAERTPTNGRFAAARIDRAMADRAVQQGPKILIVAALESTLAPTARLIDESAKSLRLLVEPQSLIVKDAWASFLAGDRTAYVARIADAVRSACAGFDVVVLAQASMAAAAEELRDLDIPVLASPRLGVGAAFAQLTALKGTTAAG
jgi:hypothetical protein